MLAMGQLYYQWPFLYIFAFKILLCIISASQCEIRFWSQAELDLDAIYAIE